MQSGSSRIEVLDDGRVEIKLLMPLPVFRYRQWVKFYTPQCELVIEGDKIAAIRCPPKAWEETLKSLAPNRPELLKNFKKMVEEGIRKLAEKRKRLHNVFEVSFLLLVAIVFTQLESPN